MARVKGIHPLERHAEKIVLGVVLLVVVVALAMQFLPGRHDIEVAPGQRVAPQDVFVPLTEEARRLQARLQDTAPPVPEISDVDLTQGVDAAIGRPLIEGVPVAAVAWGPNPEIVVGGAGPLPDSFAAFVPPAPAIDGGYSHWVTVDPFFAAAHPDLAERFADGQPYDLAGVTAAATFDGAALEQALRGGADGGRGVPVQWWRGNIAVLDVQAERQQRLPDGSWSDPETVGIVLPTEFQPLASSAATPTPDEMPRIVQAAVSQASAVLSPEYLPQISGLPWLPPREWQARQDRMGQINEALQIERRIRDLQGQLERLERRSTSTQSSDDGPTRTGLSGGGAGGRGGGGADRPNREQTEAERLQSTMERLRAEIAAEQTKLQSLGLEGGIAVFLDPTRVWASATPEDQAAPGASPTGNQRGATTPGSGGLGTRQATGTPNDPTRPARSGDAGGKPVEIIGNPNVPVWVHDIAVEPGATYRYRLRVVMNNPYFGRAQNLGDAPEQQELSASPTVESPWSEWTDPVEVAARQYIFVASASDGEGGVGSALPNATIELYEMYYGFYRRGNARIVAGEPPSDGVSLPPTLVLVDPEVATPQALAELLAQRQAASAAATGTDGSSSGPSSRGRQGIGGGGVIPDSPKEAAVSSAEIPLPPGIQAAPKTWGISGGVILLDVASVPATTRNQLGGQAPPSFEAVFRDADGELLVRTQAADANAPQRRFASFLADLGELGVLFPSRATADGTGGRDAAGPAGSSGRF